MVKTIWLQSRLVGRSLHSTVANRFSHSSCRQGLNPNRSINNPASDIFWSGSADGSTAPTNILAYYEAMQSYIGKERAQRFTRPYLFPGGYHGNGNPGPIDCDLLTAVINWVEKGTAPYRLISYYLPFIDQKGGRYGPYGTTIDISKSYRSRPVYPYPEVAHYKGSGSVDEAENFDAGIPAAKHPEFRWIGLPSFLTPVQPLWCGWTGMTFSCGTEQK